MFLSRKCARSKPAKNKNFMLDRRRYPRFYKTFPVLISTLNVEKKLKTIDVSLGGCAIYYSQAYYDRGTIFPLEILLSRDETFKCNSEVVWIKPRNKSAAAYKIGLKFLNTTPEDQERLRRYIEPLPQG